MIELPVISTALLLALAYGYKRLVGRIEGLHDHMTASVVADAQVRRDIDVNAAGITRLRDVELPRVRETGAVTAAELESHLRWHERHPL